MTRLPTEAEEKLHLEWTRNLIDSLVDGGTWAIPRSGTIVTLDHSTKTATFSTKVEGLAEYYFKQLRWKVRYG